MWTLKILQSFLMYSFNRYWYLLNIYYVLGTILNTLNTMVNKIDKVFAFFGSCILVGKPHENQIMIDTIQRIKLQ